MPEDKRTIHGGQQAREQYSASLASERLKNAAERVVNPRVEKEYNLLQLISFPFDREEAPLQSAVAVPAGAVQALQKVPFLAAVHATFVQVGLPIVATLLIGGGLTLGVVSIVNNIALQNQVKNYATEANDSGQSNKNAGFVPSTDPKEPIKVEIADLSIIADTTKVNVNSKGNIGSPANIKQLAWYDQSSSPVDRTGNALIVGHVGTSSYAGAFAELHKVKNDAAIKLTMGDGKLVNYKVTKLENIAADKIEMSDYFTKLNQTDKNLVLITCSGEYNSDTYSYPDRLVITAAAIN